MDRLSGSPWWGARLNLRADEKALIPRVWQIDAGNAVVGKDRLWRFAILDDREAFVGRDEEGYFVLYEAREGELPTFRELDSFFLALSFVVGRPVAASLLCQLDGDAGVCGLLRLDMHLPAPGRSLPSALPFLTDRRWLVRFVELATRFLASEKGRTLRVAMGGSMLASDGTVEARFLQNWVGAEALAQWLIEERGVSRAAPALLVTSANEWKDWMRRHDDELRGLAVTNKDYKTLKKNLHRAARREYGRIARAMEGLGLSWTDEMAKAADYRNSVAHEGTGGPLTAESIRGVGLLQTILAALVAKTIGYDGPLADRSKDYINASDVIPEWWSYNEQAPQEVQFGGTAAKSQELPGSEQNSPQK